MAQWFSAVQSDIAKVIGAIAYYEKEFITAKMETSLKGRLEHHSRDMPGIVAYRFGQLQEIEAILEYLNIDLRRIRSRHYRKYLEAYNKQLSSRDAEKYADGEDEVLAMHELINEFSLIRNQFIGITKALEVKGFQINNLVKLRTAGMEDLQL